MTEAVERRREELEELAERDLPASDLAARLLDIADRER